MGFLPFRSGTGHIIIDDVPHLSPHCRSCRRDTSVVLQASASNLTDFARLILAEVGHRTNPLCFAVIAARRHLIPLRVDRLIANAHHDVSLATMLDPCSKSPPICSNQSLTIYSDIDRGYHVGSYCVDSLSYWIYLINRDLLRMFFADCVGKWDFVVGGFFSQSIKTLPDLFNLIRINGVRIHFHFSFFTSFGV